MMAALSGNKVHFELTGHGPMAQIPPELIHRWHRERPRSNARAWDQKDKSTLGVHDRNSEMILGGDCPTPIRHGARSGQGSKSAAGDGRVRRARPPANLSHCRSCVRDEPRKCFIRLVEKGGNRSFSQPAKLIGHFSQLEYAYHQSVPTDGELN
jgi:hypothetical protein